MTIKDIAAYTGYSVGTVSRVLNNQPNVSPKARAAVLQAADKLGFQLNANAKQLKQQHGNSILVVVKGRSNELFSAMVEVIQAQVAQTSYPLIVDYVDEEADEVQRAVRLCAEKKPLGVLFLGGNRENFRHSFDKIQAPCVLVTNNAADLGFSNLSSISSDDRAAAAMAVEHLIGLGHQRIAIIGGDREASDIGRLRFNGCLEAFAGHNIVFDPEQDYETIRYSFADGYKAARRLLEKGRAFTALFCMSDVMAIGAIRALADMGKNVPGDVSVIGFDGLTFGEYTTPRLSTIRQNAADMAHQSVQLLLEHIEDKTQPSFRILPVTLEQKETTGVPVE